MKTYKRNSEVLMTGLNQMVDSNDDQKQDGEWFKEDYCPVCDHDFCICPDKQDDHEVSSLITDDFDLVEWISMITKPTDHQCNVLDKFIKNARPIEEVRTSSLNMFEDCPTEDCDNQKTLIDLYCKDCNMKKIINGDYDDEVEVYYDEVEDEYHGE